MAPSNQDDFDGYRKWLGITSKQRPPTHYDLLKISLDEDDDELIRAAAEQRRHYVESKRGQGHDALVAEILMRIDEAEITLLNFEMRRDYDRQQELFEKRRKNRQVDPNSPRSRVKSRPGKTVGEDGGIVKTFAGIVAILCVAFGVMAWFAFNHLWKTPERVPEQVAARHDQVIPSKEVGPSPKKEPLKLADLLKLVETELAGIGEEKDRDETLVAASAVRASHKEYDAALTYLDRLDKPSDKGIVLRVLAGGLARNGLFDRAKQTVGRIADPFETYIAYEHIGKAYVDIGDMDAARQMFQASLTSAKQVVDRSMASNLLVRLVKQYAEFVDGREVLAEAWKIAKVVSDPKQRQWAMQNVVEGYLRLRELKFAKEAAAIIDPPHDKWGYDNIARECFERGDIVMAEGLLKEAYGGDSINRHTVERAVATARNGDFAEAKDIALKLTDPFESLRGLLQVAEACSTAENIDLANECLADAEKLLDRIPFDGQKTEGVIRIVSVCGKMIASKQSDRGLGLRVARQRDDQNGLMRLCVAYAGAKSIPQAKEIMVDPRLGNLKRHAVRSVAKSETRAGGNTSVPDWISPLPTNLERAWAYLGCCDALLPEEPKKPSGDVKPNKNGVSPVVKPPTDPPKPESRKDSLVKQPDPHRLFSGHTQAVRQLAISSDGKLLASAGDDRTVRLWELETGKQIWTTTWGDSTFKALAIESTGKRIWAVDGSAVCVIDRETGDAKDVMSLKGKENHTVTFGKNCSSLAAVTEGKTRLYDTNQKKELKSFIAHPSVVAFNRDATILAMGGWEDAGDIQSFRLNEGKTSGSFSGLKDRTMALQISPDDKYVAAASGCAKNKKVAPSNTIMVWESATGRNVMTQPIEEGWCYGLCFSTDGTLLAAGGCGRDSDWGGYSTPQNNKVRVWRIRDGKELHAFTGHTTVVQSVVFTPDSKSIVSGSVDNTIRIWSLDSSRLRVDREVAEWVLAKGGKVKVTNGEEQSEIQTQAQLPSGDFNLVEVDLKDRKEFGDQDVRRLLGLSHLARLSLMGTSVTDNALKDVGEITSLTYLNVAGTSINGSGFQHLENLDALGMLLCGGAPINDAGLPHLKRLPKLEDIGLIDTQVTDAGMPAIAAMKQLKVLRLAGSKVTDKGLNRLTALKSLEKLLLNRTLVSKKGVATIRAALPKCEVTAD